jgi:SAM-dependent methyltransferase
MDKKYWNKYYSNDVVTEEPSDFAQFCINNYKKECGSIIDIGCGNGRDTFFFSSQSIQSIGLDQSEIVIKGNKAKSSKLGLNCSFFVGDFSNFDFDSICHKPYSIYSRFTLHAINYKEEDKLFKHLFSNINLKYLFIEVRSIRDLLYGEGKEVGLHEFVTSHYRRFINPKKLISKLKENFEILYFKESQGFAKTKTEDPWIIRTIVKRI